LPGRRYFSGLPFTECADFWDPGWIWGEVVLQRFELCNFKWKYLHFMFRKCQLLKHRHHLHKLPYEWGLLELYIWDITELWILSRNPGRKQGKLSLLLHCALFHYQPNAPKKNILLASALASGLCLTFYPWE
jgi:hypothetical protein